LRIILNKIFPILESIKGYHSRLFRADLIAGITVAVIFIPQAIAYAYLAGMPPIYGLYAGIIPLVVYAIFGTSRQMSIGPVAITAILIMSGVSQLAEPLSQEYISLTLLAGLLIGLTQILFSFLRLGFFVNFLSHPVIAGFISAAGVIILVSQFKDALGIAIPRSLNTFETFIYAMSNIGETHLLTLIICLSSLIIMMLLKKWKKAFPSELLVVFLTTLGSYIFNFEDVGVAIIRDVPKGFPSFFVPEMDLASIRALIPTVLTVTFIGIVGSIGIAKSLEMKHRSYTVKPNQELFALGMAKLTGAFFQALPVSGSFTRSAINDGAGAKTTVSSIITAFLVMLALLFLTPLFYYIPKAVLAAIILVSVFSLVDVAEAKFLYNARRRDFSVMMLTFMVTLILGIESGVVAGIIFSFSLLLYSSSRPNVVELGNIPGTTHYRNVDRFSKAQQSVDYLILRFDNQIIFSNANYFKDAVKRFLSNRKTPPRFLILDASSIHDIDSTGLHALQDVYQLLKTQDIQLIISGATGPIRDLLKRSGLMDAIGEKNHFMYIRNAVNIIAKDEETDDDWSEDAIQFNKR
jgi:SulP family sulfate permease